MCALKVSPSDHTTLYHCKNCNLSEALPRDLDKEVALFLNMETLFPKRAPAAEEQPSLRITKDNRMLSSITHLIHKIEKKRKEVLIILIYGKKELSSPEEARFSDFNSWTLSYKIRGCFSINLAKNASSKIHNTIEQWLRDHPFKHYLTIGTSLHGGDSLISVQTIDPSDDSLSNRDIKRALNRIDLDNKTKAHCKNCLRRYSFSFMSTTIYLKSQLLVKKNQNTSELKLKKTFIPYFLRVAETIGRSGVQVGLVLTSSYESPPNVFELKKLFSGTPLEPYFAGISNEVTHLKAIKLWESTHTPLRSVSLDEEVLLNFPNPNVSRGILKSLQLIPPIDQLPKKTHCSLCVLDKESTNKALCDEKDFNKEVLFTKEVLLFLGIVGVLVSPNQTAANDREKAPIGFVPSWQKLDPRATDLLMILIWNIQKRGFDVKIVITSSWRTFQSTKALCNQVFASAPFGKYLVGRTVSPKHEFLEKPRLVKWPFYPQNYEQEIYHWILRHDVCKPPTLALSSEEGFEKGVVTNSLLKEQNVIDALNFLDRSLEKHNLTEELESRSGF